MTTNTAIKWPRGLSANRDMIYQSLDLLYHNVRVQSFSEEMSFIVSACSPSIFRDNDPIGLIHKVDVITMPKFSNAKIEVTHEVKPGLDGCSRIVHVNDRLKAAAFDQGCVMPIKNFGPMRTFHTDVRGSLQHHRGQVCCLASDRAGNQLASACTSGHITLYQVREEEIMFLTRTDETQAKFITDLTFLQPSQGFSFGRQDPGMYKGENVLIYSTHDGRVGLLDTRCSLAQPISADIVITSAQPTNFMSLTCLQSKPDQILYLGSAVGDLFASDLRMLGRYILHQKSTDVGCIERMKEIIVNDGLETFTFLAHTTSNNRIRILDIETMKPSKDWTCDRLPEGRVRDLTQVGNRIITCGEMTSIGCWEWNKPSPLA